MESDRVKNIRRRKEALSKQRKFEIGKKYYSFSWDKPYIKTYEYKGTKYNQHEFFSLDCKYPVIASILKIKITSWQLWDKCESRKEVIKIAIEHFENLSNDSLRMKKIFEGLK